MLTLFYFGFHKIKDLNIYHEKTKAKFSILIPFRNEEENLITLLISLKNLDYPTSYFEVILINDFSTDDSKNIIEHYCITNAIKNFSIISNQKSNKSPKKTALLEGVKKSHYPWIITTDADCIIPKNWLHSYNCVISKDKPDMICGPVSFTHDSNFISKFQILDMLTLQTTTVSSFGLDKPFLCNGANLAYNKKVFFNLNAFEDNDHIISGDDTFTLQKFIKNKKKVTYVKSLEAQVLTTAQKSISDLINQRLRWVSKSNHYNIYGKITGMIVVVTNFYMVWLILFTFYQGQNLKKLVALFILKFIIDYIYITLGNSFFKLKISINDVIISSFVYPFYCVLIALMAPFSRFQWKERTFNTSN